MRRRCVRTSTGAFVINLLLAGLVAAALGDDLTAPKKVRRWESNLSIGRVSNGRLGVVKSLWWFGVPNVLALGLSFDCIFQEAIPLSIDVAVNAPLPVVRPFVCAGAGTALNGKGITHYGGGLKVRLGRRFGLVAEYRHYYYGVLVHQFPSVWGKTDAHYFGAGISWVY